MKKPVMSELETKVKLKNLDLVTCPNQNCEVKGDYYKCYLGNEKHCPIFLHSFLPKYGGYITGHKSYDGLQEGK